MNPTYRILDVTCSARSIWYQKNRGDVVYGDIRVADIWVGKGKNGRRWKMSPNVQFDYTRLPFPNNHFKLVVWDPPHLINVGDNSWLAQKYGKLFADWRDNLRGGFDECFRVLEENGILIFKWSEAEKTTKEVLSLAPAEPLFGHTTRSKSKTNWLTFMKETK